MQQHVSSSSEVEGQKGAKRCRTLALPFVRIPYTTVFLSLSLFLFQHRYVIKLIALRVYFPGDPHSILGSASARTQWLP